MQALVFVPDLSISVESDIEGQDEAEDAREDVCDYRTELGNIRKWSIRVVTTIYSGLKQALDEIRALKGSNYEQQARVNARVEQLRTVGPRIQRRRRSPGW